MAGKGSFIFVIGFGIIMGYIILNLTSLGTRATENIINVPIKIET